MELVLVGLVAVVTLGSTVVTLSWVVPAASDLYLVRKASRQSAGALTPPAA